MITDSTDRSSRLTRSKSLLSKWNCIHAHRRSGGYNSIQNIHMPQGSPPPQKGGRKMGKGKRSRPKSRCAVVRAVRSVFVPRDASMFQLLVAMKTGQNFSMVRGFDRPGVGGLASFPTRANPGPQRICSLARFGLVWTLDADARNFPTRQFHM